MVVFLTGATGFIGGHIEDVLTRHGHRVVPHEGSTREILAGLPAETDLVVNSAGRLGGERYPDSMLLEANLDLPVRLAKLCRNRNVPLIHLSTPGVCGLRPQSKETDDYAPEGVYEETKAQAEIQLLNILPDVTILRPDFVFGKGDMHKYPLFRQVSRGFFPLVGTGIARTRPTDVEDVACAVLNAFPQGPLHRGIYNIGGPDILTVREIAHEIARALGKGIIPIPIPGLFFRTALKLGPLCPAALSESRYRLFSTHRYVDISKASEAGFLPSRRFRETADSAVEWYRERGLL